MKIKFIMILMLIVNACSKEVHESKNEELENNNNTIININKDEKIDDSINKDSKIVFYIDDNLSLYESQLINKLQLPCKENTLLPQSRKQLPNSRYYLLNKEVRESGINLQCLPESNIYPVSEGIVVDVETNNKFDITTNNEFYNLATRLIDKLGYMPNDIKHILFENYVTIDHGFYFSKDFRTISIYSNLKDIPENIEIGKQVNSDTILGLIENEKIYPLSATLLQNDEGVLEVQKDILNFEMYFENKGGIFHLGQGVTKDISTDYYNSFFITETE
tara:strand:- start:390 stop:1220 length:831 start_codon:yes stop_codon:yes gene_type:complete